MHTSHMCETYIRHIYLICYNYYVIPPLLLVRTPTNTTQKRCASFVGFAFLLAVSTHAHKRNEIACHARTHPFGI